MTLPLEERISRERMREQTIDQAIEASERIILAATDGSNETLLWLTLEMSRKYQEKAMMMISAMLHRKELFEEDKNHAHQ